MVVARFHDCTCQGELRSVSQKGEFCCQEMQTGDVVYFGEIKNVTLTVQCMTCHKRDRSNTRFIPNT